MGKIKVKNVFLNIFKLALLRYTLLIILATAVFVPVYSYFNIFPQFNNQLTRYTEDAAVRVANHLKASIYTKDTALTAKTFSPSVIDEIIKLKQDLRIEKIKIFSEDGIVLFSSVPKDIGEKNTHPYFYDQISLGNIFSKRIKKNSRSLEGRILNAEVVESYVPIMNGDVFYGAVEIYYNITASSKKLSQLLNRLMKIILSFSSLVLIILLVILYKASKDMLLKEKVEHSLQKAQMDLEQIVLERTMALEKTNQTLTHEIEERSLTEISLQRSYETQTIVNQLLRESMTDAKIMDMIETCLDLVLSLPWLSFKSMGCIYLVGQTPDVLEMKAHRRFSKELQTACSKIPFGQYLCGKAASEQNIVFVNHIDDHHDTPLPGMEDHGNYYIPLIAKKQTLGVINIYIKPGHKQNEQEESFLKAVANTLSGIIIQRKGEQQKKEIEKKLHQSQKMEAIGTLAGGIAHDFNNILSGIFGYVQLAKINHDNPDKVDSCINQISKGAKRATDLIQQILTFSRQTDHEKKSVQLSDIIIEVNKFLRSSIPANIKIIENISSKSKVKADPTQMHQIVMNLCTNAYYSMKNNGGDLFVSLSETKIQKTDQIPGLKINPGNYLKLEVKDTGTGMPPHILNKIFEPYFTTKRVGEGTGLGLAVVLGIIEEHCGYIRADSEVDKGSIFHVYLPVHKNIENQNILNYEDHLLKGGTEKIIVVDDEDFILDSTAEYLKDFGYKVSTFSDAEEAFKALKKDALNFDLIITDMTMPKMTGDEFVKKVLTVRDDIPIILCSGYSNKASRENALKIGAKKYLQKPVDGALLLVSIREVLN